MHDRIARTVLVTGGTGALGGAVTRRFLEEGHRVAVTWRTRSERDATAASLASYEDRLSFVEADVTDADAVAGAVAEAASSVGPVEVLAHLVGGWRGGARVASHDLGAWEDMIRRNLTSAFLCSRAVLPSMLERGWGRIVLVSSRTAVRNRSGAAGYAVAKAGVVVLAETIAEETRGTGVTANVVAPSVIDTPANRASLTSDPSTWVPAEDMAAAIAFLASEEAGQLRGAFLPVYGSA